MVIIVFSSQRQVKFIQQSKVFLILFSFILLGTALMEWEYYLAEGLKKRFLERYGGKSLDEVFSGEEVGNCYLIEKKERVKIRFPESERARWNLLSCLSLIPGIGPNREKKLKERGYSTLRDLINHPRFKDDASKILKCLEERRIYEILEHMGRRFRKSHPLILQCAALHNLEKFLVLDIETLGLFNAPIILIGTGEFRQDELTIRQYFARNLEEEKAIILKFLELFRDKEALLTFNGRRFDVPFIQERLRYYGIEESLEIPNYDVFLFSRSLIRGVPNYKLQTLERYLLGFKRGEDVPSALIPDFYRYYLNTGDVALVIPIIKHNALDIVTTVKLFGTLLEMIKD
ncbi:ribonuclease H-like domain-containing protein [Thermococcus sp. EP1]|uniref:ribonuclease H-like domain-containing protein n=1 Tax=Thermococcus sp. EP1 TaxID=1591054 RepID=UPI0012E0F069|nr:ribonuclease H-like domain-containing protein [Thermococcus sp. EP1]